MASSDFLFSDPAPTLAVVIADSVLRENLLDQLRSRGAAVWGADSELAFYRGLAVRKTDLVLVDESLPNGAGTAILSHLQPLGTHGLIALVHPESEAQVRERGVHCCVAKPVHFQRLLYCLAMLWESRCQQNLRSEGWWLDPQGPRLVAPDGRSMLLTTTEQRFLGGLMACYGQTLTKEQLVILLWGKYSDRDYHGVEVLLSRLRRKAQTELGQALPVRAVQAVGLLFSGQVIPSVP
ncbi:MAG: winged helix-turn-helix domain-containing protein [Azovibrio sp.]|uniref:response regulator transcription factor n=1 Tax=Azovibrio sp. TaxID=1872673 RepID=UPI003C72374A